MKKHYPTVFVILNEQPLSDYQSLNKHTQKQMYNVKKHMIIVYRIIHLMSIKMNTTTYTSRSSKTTLVYIYIM